MKCQSYASSYGHGDSGQLCDRVPEICFDMLLAEVLCSEKEKSINNNNNNNNNNHCVSDVRFQAMEN
jgi:hypothetical protein